MIDGLRAHRLEVHVEQQAGTRLNKATDVENGAVLILHPEAHRTPRQLLQVNILEAVLKAGPSARL